MICSFTRYVWWLSCRFWILPLCFRSQSEFIAECYMRRAYISGFTGSAGTAVVTKQTAALWTDGRYFLQVWDIPNFLFVTVLLLTFVGLTHQCIIICKWSYLPCSDQAEKQLNSSWTLMRAGNPGVPSTSEWLNDVLSPGSRIGIDPVSYSIFPTVDCFFLQ